MWFESFSMSDDVCTAASGLRRFRYDAGLGMSGAPLWTADNTVRYVASGLGFADGNGAAPITPTVSSWMLDFLENNIECVGVAGAGAGARAGGVAVTTVTGKGLKYQ